METSLDREWVSFEGGYGIYRDHMGNYYLGFRVYRSYRDSGKKMGTTTVFRV